MTQTPMCDKLAANRSTIMTVMEFIAWLRTEKTGDIGFWQHGFFETTSVTDEKLLYEYLEINGEALEKERRALMAEQCRVNGDMEEDDAPR